MFLKLLPILLSTLALVSIVLYLVPDEEFTKYMGEDSGAMGWMTAALIGSVVLIPGFIAYPLCGTVAKLVFSTTDHLKSQVMRFRGCLCNCPSASGIKKYLRGIEDQDLRLKMKTDNK